MSGAVGLTECDVLHRRAISPPRLCVFTSVNDTLDPRQEDWLMILNNGGLEARVCKFLDQKGWDRMEKKKEKEKGDEGEKKEKKEAKASPKRKGAEAFEPEEGTFKVRRIRRWDTGGKSEELVKSFSDAVKAQRCYEGEVANRRGRREWKDVLELWAGRDVFMRDVEEGFMEDISDD